MSSATDPAMDRWAAGALEVGGRLTAGPSDLLVQTAFKKELEAQWGLFDAMGLADLAHTLVMMEAGVIPAAAGRELLEALVKLQERPADFVPEPARGDLYTNREAWLLQHGAAAGWLGAGRARREATTTAFLITLREALLGLAAALAAAGRILTVRARECHGTLMPDYTYLHPAQPTTFGHYLLGFVYPMLRDLERVRALYGRINKSPAGCGSTNGSRLPQNRERLAELLGFDGLVTHARDAMWQADLPIETSAAVTAILVNLDRLAEDLQIFSTQEFGLVELDDRHSRASKIMPQKKNPFALTHVRGLANSMIGTLAASAASGRTPSGQPDNRLPLYGIVPGAVQDARDAVNLIGEVVNVLRFDAEQASRRLDHGFAAATDLADVLMSEAGVDAREAHRLVGCLVRQHAADASLNGLTTENLSAVSEHVLGRRVELSASALDDALNPRAAIAARTVPGGAAAEALEMMSAECVRCLEDATDWTETCRQHLGRSQDALTGGVRMALTR